MKWLKRISIAALVALAFFGAHDRIWLALRHPAPEPHWIWQDVNVLHNLWSLEIKRQEAAAKPDVH